MAKPENITIIDRTVDRTHSFPGLDDEQHLRMFALSLACSPSIIRLGRKDSDAGRDVALLAEEFVAYVKGGTISEPRGAD